MPSGYGYTDYFNEPETPERRFVDCPECDGEGKLLYHDTDDSGAELPYYDECEYCNGTGQLEVTEED